VTTTSRTSPGVEPERPHLLDGRLAQVAAGPDQRPEGLPEPSGVRDVPRAVAGIDEHEPVAGLDQKAVRDEARRV
jgi:hypothetical protein